LRNSRLKDAPFSKGEMEVQDSNSQLCVGPSQNGPSRFKFTMTEFRPATSECPSSITSRTEAALDRSDSGCASEDEEVSQDSPPPLPVKPEESSAPEDIVICWRQSGKLWDARMQDPEKLLSQVSNVKQIELSAHKAIEENGEKKIAAIADIRGKVYSVLAQDLAEAKRSIALQVLKKCFGIELVAHRTDPSTKPSQMENRDDLPSDSEQEQDENRARSVVDVLRRVQGEEVKLRFAQHWSRGNEEILTYETVIGGKTLSAKGPDTDSAANAVALAALIKFYPPQLLDRVHGTPVEFHDLSLIDNEHVTVRAEVNGHHFTGRGPTRKEAVHNAAISAIYSQYKTYLDAVCHGLAVDPKPLSLLGDDDDGEKK